jgi:hypothetical protein
VSGASVVDAGAVVAFYERAWPELLEAHAAAVTASVALQAAEARLRGVSAYGCALSWEPRKGGEVEQLAQRLVGALVALAETTLPPAGAEMRIKLDEVVPRWFDGRALKETFSPRAVWMDLVERYGGSAAADTAYAQAADELVRYFGLAGRPSMHRVGGVIEISRIVHAEAVRRSRRKLGYYSGEALKPALKALEAWASWMNGASASEEAEAIGGIRTALLGASADDGFTSRQKIGTPALEVVTYFNKLVFRFPVASAEKLNEFVSTFSERLREAA